jgi:hypothetical protein
MRWLIAGSIDFTSSPAEPWQDNDASSANDVCQSSTWETFARTTIKAALIRSSSALSEEENRRRKHLLLLPIAATSRMRI